MKKYFLTLCVVPFLFINAQGQNKSVEQLKDSTVIPLWDGKPPFSQKTGPEKYQPDKGDNISRLTNVSDPAITIYQSKKIDKSSQPKPAVVICPGGGYYILAMNLEGTEIASWLTTLGVRPIILKYRVPNNRKGAYADAQRAMSILRSRADEFNIDPDKIGIMGFSAGGHLSARMSTHFSHRIYNTTDQYDKADMRPDFGILIYPAYLVNKKDEVSKEVKVNANTPPMFLVQAEDDPIGYQNSLFFYDALSRKKISAELHLFAHGGHGYGLRVDDSNPLSQWAGLCAKWLKSIDIIQ